MYKYVLFDFDGTVYDTVEGISKCAKYAVNSIGLDAPLAYFRCFAGPPLGEMFMQKFGVDKDTAASLVMKFRERYVPMGIYESRPFEGIKELLADLKKAGCLLAVTTLKPTEMAEKLISLSGMDGLFDLVIGIEGEQDRSTKSEIIERVMKKFGCSREQTVLVGDTKYDIEGAHNCGIKAIGAEYGFGAEGELEGAGADMIVGSVEELKKALL